MQSVAGKESESAMAAFVRSDAEELAGMIAEKASCYAQLRDRCQALYLLSGKKVCRGRVMA